MAEPGFGWDLWRFTGLGDTGHGLPSRYLKGRSADTDNKWECLHQGGSRPNPPMLQGLPHRVGTATLRQGGGWLPGSVGALQPQPTKTQEAPQNSVQGFFPTNYSDCWLWSIQSSRPHPKGCWSRLPSNQCLEWAPPCAQPPVGTFCPDCLR